jgi:predicted  nucleic acid-binding Zn-ribbon protein
LRPRLWRFDTQATVRFGDATVVALEHEVCTGCHMKVTTQTAHRVKNGKEIVSCEQCGRILYAAE